MEEVPADKPDPLRRLLDEFRRHRNVPAMEEIVRRTRRKLLSAARRIGSPQDAEDSVQAAYHALLARPEAPTVAVLPWLVAAVVRIAYLRKAIARREARLVERLACQQSEGSPPNQACRAEVAALVRREVERLSARYRDPVVLYYLECLSVGETARLLDIPESTVRTRLQRARTLLRSRFAPSLLHAVLVVPWFLADCCRAAAAGDSIVIGGMMKAKAWILVGGVAVATGAIGLLAGLPASKRAPDMERSARADGQRDKEVAQFGGLAPESEGVTSVLRSEVERLRALVADFQRRLAETRPVRLAEETVDASTAGIHVDVLDETGRPQPALEVAVTRHAHPYRREGGETDAEGRVEIYGLPPGNVILTVRSPEALASRAVGLAAGRVTEVSVVFPREGVPVSGAVIDRRLGRLADVVVGLLRWEGSSQLQYQAKTNERGRYRFVSVPSGVFTLSVLVGDPSEGRRAAAQILVPREGSLEKDMLVGFRSIFGTVRDAETGREIPGCTVSVAQPNSILSRNPGDGGAFEFLDLAPGVYRMWSRAPGHVRKTKGDVVVLAEEEQRIDFELEPAAVLILTVLDQEGHPVTGPVDLSIRSPEGPQRSESLPAGEGGLMKIDEIPPGEHEIAVQMRGIGGGRAISTLVPGENRLTIRLE